MNPRASYRKYKRKLNFLVARLLFSRIPIKNNKVVFDNFIGKGYGDSPKYIANEILRRGLNYDLVWIVGFDITDKFPKGIRTVHYGTLRFFYEIATAKVWVDNIKNCLEWKKRDEQYYIQTWHGGGISMKLIEAQVEHSLNPRYVKISQNDSQNINLFLSDCSLFTRVIHEAFWLPDTCEVFEHGLPRNDALFKTQDECMDIKRKLIGCEDKIALYAPTFRDDYSVKGYYLDAEWLHRTLEKKTGEKWKVIIRLHPIARRYANIFTYSNHVLNGSIFPDSQQVILASDILITDYSSILSYFFILKRPIFLFTLDLKHYESCCRPLPDIYRKLPFPLCQSNQELMDAIMNYTPDTYTQKVEFFSSQYYKSYDDGHASEHVVDRINQVIDGTCIPI